MTLEELKNKRITISYMDSFPIGDDMSDEALEEILQFGQEEDMNDQQIIDLLCDDYKDTINNQIYIHNYKITID